VCTLGTSNCVAYTSVYNFSIVIGGEHKAHVVQVNNKNHNLKY
jgi:hypothetical protein